jgi:hypothetical protein
MADYNIHKGNMGKYNIVGGFTPSKLPANYQTKLYRNNYTYGNGGSSLGVSSRSHMPMPAPQPNVSSDNYYKEILDLLFDVLVDDKIISLSEQQKKKDIEKQRSKGMDPFAPIKPTYEEYRKMRVKQYYDESSSKDALERFNKAFDKD